MKIGDLIEFTGTWGSAVKAGDRQTGIVTEVWKDGRTGRLSTVDIFWDNGDCTATSPRNVKVVNESR